MPFASCLITYSNRRYRRPAPGATLYLYEPFGSTINAEWQWRYAMPGEKHLRGVGKKEQREYEHIKESAEKSGRYGKRAEEVAARTVMKHHKEEGHKKGR